MSTTTAGILFLVSLIVALAAVHVPLGDYMYRVYTSNKDSRGERVIYRLIGADPKAEQTWGAYARSVLAFSAISILFLFVFQLVQGKLPLHLNDPATQMTPALAWNTAVSFVTNTNWQAYSGESTQGHLVQMAGLAVQNFVSAAVGMAVAIALVRGLRPPQHRRARQLLGGPGPRHHSNPAADLGDRGDHPGHRRLYPELPPARPGRQHVGRRPADHHRRTGGQPGVDQGTRHQRWRFLQRQLVPTRSRTRTRWTNWVEIFLLLVISFSLPRTFGRMVESKKQGYAIAAVMAVIATISVSFMMLFQLQHHGTVPHRSRCGDGRCRTALRRRQLGGVRGRDDADIHRRGRLVPRLVHQPRRHDHAVQHAARRGRARRNGLGPVRHARSSRSSPCSSRA